MLAIAFLYSRVALVSIVLPALCSRFHAAVLALLVRPEGYLRKTPVAEIFEAALIPSR